MRLKPLVFDMSSSTDPVQRTLLADEQHVEPEVTETAHEAGARSPRATATPIPPPTAARRRQLDLSEGQPALHSMISLKAFESQSVIAILIHRKYSWLYATPIYYMISSYNPSILYDITF